MVLSCSRCGAELHPTGRGERVRCEYCGADELLDGATLAALSQSAAPPPGMSLERILERLGADLHDASAFLDGLSQRLGATLPKAVSVERKGGLFGKARTVRVVADLGERRFAFWAEGERLAGSQAHVVRGVVLKTQERPIADLLNALAAELYERSQADRETEAALRKLIG